MKLIKPHKDGDCLLGRLMCYRCRHSFPIPKNATKYGEVKCPNCKDIDSYDQHKCHYLDPWKHTLGWPYDDPTINFDC